MTTRSQVVAVSATVVLLGAACSAEAGSGAAAVPRDTIAGVEIVWNPSGPVGPAVDAALLWEQGGGDGVAGAGASPWEEPVAIAAASTGVYVLDRLASRVWVLAVEDGSIRRAFGRPGQGPGEFDGAFGLAVVGDSVIVGSARTGSLELFHRDGAYGRRIPLGQVGFGIVPLTDRMLLLSGYAGASSSAWTVWPLDEGTDPEPLTLPDTSMTGEDLFASCLPSTTVGGRVVRVACRTPELVVYDSAGRPRKEIRVGVEPEVTSDAELDAMAERMRARIGGALPPEQASRFVEGMRENYREKPKYAMVRGDEVSGRYAVREQNPDNLGGGPATLHLFEPSGLYVSAVRFDRQWLDFDIRGDVVYALARDPATGLVSARAYRLSGPAR